MWRAKMSSCKPPKERDKTTRHPYRERAYINPNNDFEDASQQLLAAYRLTRLLRLRFLLRIDLLERPVE
jgi:hypothetical protein